VVEQLAGVGKRLPGAGVGPEVSAEDQAVGRVADPLLLFALQLARPQIPEGLEDTTVGVGTFWAHLVPPGIPVKLVTIFAA
jgi:hypothetical protein